MYIVHGLIQGSERGPAPLTTNEDIVDQSLDLFKVHWDQSLDLFKVHLDQSLDLFKV